MGQTPPQPLLFFTPANRLAVLRSAILETERSGEVQSLFQLRVLMASYLNTVDTYRTLHPGDAQTMATVLGRLKAIHEDLGVKVGSIRAEQEQERHYLLSLLGWLDKLEVMSKVSETSPSFETMWSQLKADLPPLLVLDWSQGDQINLADLAQEAIQALKILVRGEGLQVLVPITVTVFDPDPTDKQPCPTSTQRFPQIALALLVWMKGGLSLTLHEIFDHSIEVFGLEAVPEGVAPRGHQYARIFGREALVDQAAIVEGAIKVDQRIARFVDIEWRRRIIW